MARADTGRLTATRSARWSAAEDFVLQQLIGVATYRQIAVRLGRSPSAVQRRASIKGYSHRAAWRTDKQTRTALQEKALRASEEDLAEFL